MIAIYDKSRPDQTGSRERYKRFLKELLHEQGVKRELENAQKMGFQTSQFTDIRGVTYMKIYKSLKNPQIVRVTRKV